MLQIFHWIKKVKIKNLEVYHKKEKEDLCLIHKIQIIKSKKIIINTDNINVEKIKGKTNFQNQKRRGSYSDLFKLKQNYITNDIHLSQKQGSKYSDLYKNGIRVFEDFDIEDNKIVIIIIV